MRYRLNMRLFSFDLPVVLGVLVFTQPNGCDPDPAAPSSPDASNKEATLLVPAATDWGAALCVPPERIYLATEPEHPLKTGQPLRLTLFAPDRPVEYLADDLTVVEVRSSNQHPEICVFFSGPQSELDALRHRLAENPAEVESNVWIVRKSLDHDDENVWEGWDINDPCDRETWTDEVILFDAILDTSNLVEARPQ